METQYQGKPWICHHWHYNYFENPLMEMNSFEKTLEASRNATQERKKNDWRLQENAYEQKI